MKTPKPFLLFIILIILLGSSWQDGYAQAQADIQLDSVSVDLLPEYTQPSVLVIYEIALNETLLLPQELTFSIPADAQILSVINFTPEDRPLELDYQQDLNGNWKDLLFNSMTHRIRIEYQDPNLIRNGNQRLFDYQWLSSYPVAALSISVRQPIGATTIQSQPTLLRKDGEQGEQPVFSSDFGYISAGELFNLSFSYTKDTGAVAYPALQVKPAVPIDDRVPGRTASPVAVILWLLVVSVAIVIIVGMYYLQFRTKEAQKFEHMGQGVGIMNPERQVSFCHECGMRSRAGDSYCSNCGTELRKLTEFDNYLKTKQPLEKR